tara:strand:- start:218 stop:997 length:780 start_codon:yes stop_codon:yes gene_type:complete
MLRNFYGLCGLPRAGNTIFASLINQNPTVSATANSPVCSMLTGAELLKETPTFKNYPDHKSLDSVTSNIIPNYYSEWDKEIIIDRSLWGEPDSIHALKKFAPNTVKIIVLVRDIKEIIASFIKFSYTNDTNFIALSGNTKQKRCDYIMKNGGELHKWIKAVFNLVKNHSESIHIIEYNDLANNPKNTLDGVYDYLELDRFEHTFTDIPQLSNNGIEYDDSILGGDLHKINVFTVEKNNYDMNTYLPDDMSMYNMENFWK